MNHSISCLPHEGSVTAETVFAFTVRYGTLSVKEGQMMMLENTIVNNSVGLDFFHSYVRVLLVIVRSVKAGNFRMAPMTK